MYIFKYNVILSSSTPRKKRKCGTDDDDTLSNTSAVCTGNTVLKPFSVCCSAIEHLILLFYISISTCCHNCEVITVHIYTFSAPGNNTLGLQGVWSIIYGEFEEQLLHGKQKSIHSRCVACVPQHTIHHTLL